MGLGDDFRSHNLETVRTSQKSHQQLWNYIVNGERAPVCVCAQHLRSTLLVSILQLPPCPGSAVVMASPLPAGVGQSLPSVQQVKDAAQTLIEQVDVQHTSSIEFRQKLATHFGLAPDGLESMKADLRNVFEEVVVEHLKKKKGSPAAQPCDLGPEAKNPRKAYLITAPHPVKSVSEDGHRLVAPGTYSRAQVGGFLIAALAATQMNRLEPLVFLLMAVFLERHKNGEVHFHIALLADRCFRFAPFKRELLLKNGLATHWSCTHEGYASCVAYGYLPSPAKRVEELDPEPWAWAPEGKTHPPLAEASRAPVTSKAWAARRERDRKERAAEGKGDARVRDVDLWPIVVKENIAPDEICAERLMAYAKRCGGPAMVDFCFHNWDKLPCIVARSWKVERVDDVVTKHSRTRMQIVREACGAECKCGGKWVSTAQKVMRQNGIDETEWRQAILKALVDGRAKGNLVCHAGKEGNEGKSFLLKPFLLIFGEDGVFVAPPKNAFPLMGLERARMVLLDDWRFNEDIISYAVQLLWFEGAPFVIARPQNQFTGHVRYSKDDPVFLTTLLDDLTSLKGKRFLKEGDVEMMLKRLHVFKFTTKISIPKNVAAGCARCFSRWLLEAETVSGGPALPYASAPKSLAADSVARHLDTSQAESWTVREVVCFLETLNLQHLGPAFVENAVDGLMLCELEEKDMVDNLGLKPLQARKVIRRLWA